MLRAFCERVGDHGEGNLGKGININVCLIFQANLCNARSVNFKTFNEDISQFPFFFHEREFTSGLLLKCCIHLD